MDQSYYMRYGTYNKVQSWMLVLRGRTQFLITVFAAQIRGTPFGEHYLQQIENRREYDRGRADPVANPCNAICLYCLPLMKRLAPRTSIQGLTLEDFVQSPTYHLELVATGNNEDVRIQGGKECLYTPSYDLSPMPTVELPEACREVALFQGSKISIAPTEEDSSPLRSVQGRVVMADGVLMYFKPRTAGREVEFEREVCILCRIKAAGLRKNQTRLPDLQGIVVLGEKGELTIGMLLNLIISPSIGMHLMSPGFWGRYDLHKRWEEQVVAIVQELHTHEIVWGDVNPCNVAIDEALNAWVIDFGGMNNAEFVDDDKAETMEGDWQGVQRLFRDWLPSQVV